MQVTISRTWVDLSKYHDEDGRRCTGYYALNAIGQGKQVATIEGNITVDEDERFVVVDGEQWAIGDVLAMARRGERGLAVTNA